jgi:hypothetical protein
LTRYAIAPAGPLDQIALAERGQDDHRRDPPAGDPLGRRQPVHDRHLDVQDDEVRRQILGQPYGGLAVTGLADDVVALLHEHLGQVQPDERLVLGDQYPPALGARLRVGHEPLPPTLPKSRHPGIWVPPPSA